MATGKVTVQPKLRADVIASNAALGAAVTPATTTTAGVVKKGVAVVNATDAASALTQLNALLGSLRTAGVIS